MLIKQYTCPIERVVMELWDNNGVLELHMDSQHGSQVFEVTMEEAEEYMSS